MKLQRLLYKIILVPHRSGKPDCFLDADASRVSNYMRSSSPEYDEVVLTDNSNEDGEYSEEIPIRIGHLKSNNEDDEYSEEIPIKMEHLISNNDDLLNKNKLEVLFDDSESDEFSLPQVDWACVNSQSPKKGEVNADGALPFGHDKPSTDADVPCSFTEPDAANCYHVTNSTVTALNIDEPTHYEEVCEGDTSLSEGLTFNIANVSHLEEESTLSHEGIDTAVDIAPHSASRLSRKRSRIARNESWEQAQCKRICHSIDDVPAAPCNVAGAAFPILPRDGAGSDASCFLSSCDNLPTESGSESNLVSQPTSSAMDTTVISMFSQDCDASFSQGT